MCQASNSSVLYCSVGRRWITVKFLAATKNGPGRRASRTTLSANRDPVRWAHHVVCCVLQLFYVPLALFAPVSAFMVHIQFNLLYQFWIHTEVGASLPLSA